MPKHVDWASIRKIDDIPPSNYEEFLSIKGVGPSTVRTGITLIAELIFGTKSSWKDPAKNSFAQGERMISPILLIEKVMMTLSNSYNLQLRARDISRIERIATIKKLSDYDSNIYSIMGKKERIYDRKFDFRVRSSSLF